MEGRLYTAGTSYQAHLFFIRFFAYRAVTTAEGFESYQFDLAQIDNLFQKLNYVSSTGHPGMFKANNAALLLGTINCLGVSNRQAIALKYTSAVDIGETLLNFSPSLEKQDLYNFFASSFPYADYSKVHFRARAWARKLWDHFLVRQVVTEILETHTLSLPHKVAHKKQGLIVVPEDNKSYEITPYNVGNIIQWSQDMLEVYDSEISYFFLSSINTNPVKVTRSGITKRDEYTYWINGRDSAGREIIVEVILTTELLELIANQITIQFLTSVYGDIAKASDIEKQYLSNIVASSQDIYISQLVGYTLLKVIQDTGHDIATNVNTLIIDNELISLDKES